MAITLISTQTLASPAATITFSSIAASYTDLMLKIAVRSNTTGNTEFNLGLNGSNPSSAKWLRGSGTAATSGSGTTLFAPASANTANTFSNIEAYIPNYTGTTNKSVSVDSTTENNATGSQVTQQVHALLYTVTSAVTSITISDIYGSWIAGSTVSLYGVLKGSSGGVTVS